VSVRYDTGTVRYGAVRGGTVTYGTVECRNGIVPYGTLLLVRNDFTTLYCIIKVRYLTDAYDTLDVSMQSLIGADIFGKDSFCW